MIKTKEASPAKLEKIEKVDEILANVEAYKDAFLDAKNLLLNSKTEGKKLSKKKLEKLFEIANAKKQEILVSISSCSYDEFKKARDVIEEKSKIQGIEKWIYMELRAGLLNLKDKES